MRSPYPLIPAAAAETVEVGSGHRIYIEVAGPEDGIPVVFLHGGPGSGCKPGHRQFFDPRKYRSVLIDQRGSGRSVPYGGVEDNTTQTLIADMETVRGRLGIDRWLLFGGSWGATLALAYAETYPQRVSGIVLRGTFLARQPDIEWFFASGANRLLPGPWRKFVSAVGRHGDMVGAMHEAVFGDDKRARERVVRAWSEWSEKVVMFALENPAAEPASSYAAMLAKTRIEFHYAKHRYFLRANQLLDDASRLPDVPVTIIHGQRDITCTAEAGWLVHEAIPGSKLEILHTAGHLSGEAPVTDALIRAADEFAEILGTPN